MYTIHRFHKKAKCDFGGREGEAVEISSEDRTIDHAILNLQELSKILRFRQSQEDKRNGHGDSNPMVPMKK